MQRFRMRVLYARPLRRLSLSSIRTRSLYPCASVHVCRFVWARMRLQRSFRGGVDGRQMGRPFPLLRITPQCGRVVATFEVSTHTYTTLFHAHSRTHSTRTRFSFPNPVTPPLPLHSPFLPTPHILVQLPFPSSQPANYGHAHPESPFERVRAVSVFQFPSSTK